MSGSPPKAERGPLPVGVVLAGGLARRMGGGDKALRPLGGRTLLDQVLDRLRPQVCTVVLNANGDPARFAAWALPVVQDPMPGRPGPLAGVLAGMRWTRDHAPEAADILTAPADAPFLPCDLFGRLHLARAAAGTPIALAASFGRPHPVVGLWAVRLEPALAAALQGGEQRVGAWALAQGAAVAEWGGSPDPFTNLNRAEDLAEAERRLRERAKGVPCNRRP